MLLDNTQLIRGVGVKTPDTQLVAMGFARPGLMGMRGLGYAPGEPGIDASGNIIQGVNSEIAYLTNLYRQARGLAPLPYSSMAPYETSAMQSWVLPIVALGALYLLTRRR